MQDVCIGYNEVSQLDHFHLYISEGEMVNLLGMTGAGKTLIYHYFKGHLPLKAGKVIYDGRVSEAGKLFQDVTEVVCLGQEPALIPGLSVAENIFVITGKRRVKGIFRMSDVNYRAKLLLGQYAPEILPTTLIRELTPAGQRVIELLRAIENEAKLVVIDDIFQGYGQNDMMRIIALLKSLNERGVAILYASHEMDLARGLADRVVIMRRGRNIRTFYEKDYDEQYSQQLMIGNDELPAFVHDSTCTDKAVFEISGLSGAQGIENVNMSVHEGEIIGLYDLDNRKNMAVLNMIVGEAPISGGQMAIRGKKYRPRGLTYAIKCGIGYIPYNMIGDHLVGTMSFVDNLSLPVLKATSHLKIFRDMDVPRYLEKEYRERLGIPDEEKEMGVSHFDAYIQNSILLTRWTLAHPTMIVCMEPCGNADIIMRDMIFNALSEMAKNGTAVLIASQNMNELNQICDTIYVINSSEHTFQKYDNRKLK